MFSGITGLVSQELLDDVKTFFQTRKIRSGEKQVQQFIELLEVSVALKNRESKGLTARFIANN
jgi:hypothetical protein